MGNSNNSSLAPNTELEEQHILLLLENTSFSREQILDWHSGFLKDCPSGRMNKDKFQELYSFLFPNGNARKFCKQIFKTFDRSGTGLINFSDLMFSISLTTTGDIRKKINIGFKIYDVDKNGFIDKKELAKIITAVYYMSESERRRDMAEIDINKIMAELDKNRDEFISKEEFIDGCLNNPQIVDLLFPQL